jgi:hypothetical protein
VSGPGLPGAARLARHGREVAAFRARALAAGTGWAVLPFPKPGRFEAVLPGGTVLIGTAGEILAWQEARVPRCREAALREWLGVLGKLGGEAR